MKKHHGPHPGAIAIAYTILLILTIITYNLHDALKVNAFFQFGSAIPIGLFTAAVTSRLQFLGVNVTGVTIALYGGVAASVFLIISGISTWVLSQTGDAALTHALQLLGFGLGGVTFIVTLGLMIAGISVPCLVGRYAPRWLAWLGLILAGVAEIATLSLLIPQLDMLLPVVRFLSCIWMIGLGFTLAKTRSGTATL